MRTMTPGRRKEDSACRREIKLRFGRLPAPGACRPTAPCFCGPAMISFLGRFGDEVRVAARRASGNGTGVLESARIFGRLDDLGSLRPLNNMGGRTSKQWPDHGCRPSLTVFGC